MGKYEEALEMARKIHKTYSDVHDVWGAKHLEHIFPELGESEDERIRKALVKLFEEKLEKCYEWKEGIPNRSVLDWLENQKGQKPVDNPKWNELTWKDIIELEGIINNVHYDFSAGIGQESFGKEVLERFRNKKEGAEVDACEPKPSEWSEKDEKMLRDTIRNYVYMSEERRKEIKVPAIREADATADKEIVSWLQSLRPQSRWKPSEEQMKELYDMVCECRSADQQLLQDIYFGLKKL